MASKKSADDAGQAEAQSIQDEAAEKGYLGHRPDGAIPNEEYTLKTGPASPSLIEEHIAIGEQRLAAQKRSPAKEVK